MRIGLFGGTFNPIHFGHINLAIELKEKRDLEQVWFIPTPLSPLRTQDPPLSAVHRRNMLQLALEEVPDFSLSELELSRKGPIYTIDTVKEILSEYPHHQFFLLLGEDSLLSFPQWKEPSELLRLIPLLIASRPASHLNEQLPRLGLSKEMITYISEGIVTTKQMDISSTTIRDRIKKRMYCGHLLQGKVLDYIYENQLYSLP